jgi:predicted nuclease of predicted toxin-antitoxin system
MILADEGLNGNLVRALREEGYQVIWIKETNAGMDDENIISLARQNSQVLITEATAARIRISVNGFFHITFPD